MHSKPKTVTLTQPKIPEDVLDNPTYLDKAAALVLFQKINGIWDNSIYIHVKFRMAIRKYRDIFYT